MLMICSSVFYWVILGWNRNPPLSTVMPIMFMMFSSILGWNPNLNRPLIEHSHRQNPVTTPHNSVEEHITGVFLSHAMVQYSHTRGCLKIRYPLVNKRSYGKWPQKEWLCLKIGYLHVWCFVIIFRMEWLYLEAYTIFRQSHDAKDYEKQCWK